MSINIDLSGQTALVTGGGTGIGFGIARRLLQAGATVTILGRRQDVLERAARALQADVRPGAEVRWKGASGTRLATGDEAGLHRRDPAVGNHGIVAPARQRSTTPLA